MSGRQLALQVSRESARSGLSVSFVIDRNNINKAAYYRWRRGENCPTESSIQKLKQCLSDIQAVSSVLRAGGGSERR